MKRGRKKKFIEIRIYLLDSEVYVNGNRILDEFKEVKVLNIFDDDIKEVIYVNRTQN